MKYLLILTLILIPIICGCSNVVAPAFGYEGDEAYVWPALYWTDNGATDYAWFLAYDQGTDRWHNRQIVDDMQKLQWVGQRSSIGWRASKDALANQGGQYVAALVEDGGDLELWGSPDAGWQDDAGPWFLIDEDTSEMWESVDVESRQNFIWLMAEASGSAYNYYLDLNIAAPVFTCNSAAFVLITTLQHSMVLDDNLAGFNHFVFLDSVDGSLDYLFIAPTGTAPVPTAITIRTSGAAYPKIIVDGEQRLWCFHTHTNNLDAYNVFNEPPSSATWYKEVNPVYSANMLTSNHDEIWLETDDSIWIVLEDRDTLNANSTYLVVKHRFRNGWEVTTTLFTADSTLLGDNQIIITPQICTDPIGNLLVRFVLADAGTQGGDIQGFYLDIDDYHDYTTTAPGGGKGAWTGNWVYMTDLDDSGDDVYGIVDPDACPKDADM